MMPTPDIESVVARLEKENRNLVTRLERLEKQRRSSIPAVLASVILLVCAGLLANYLGFYPPPIERLPLSARRVDAQEFIIRNEQGQLQARLVASGKGFQVLDAGGKTIWSRP
jgi:hypothetical protein